VPKHAVIEFKWRTKGSAQHVVQHVVLYYCDTRNYGVLKWMDDEELAKKLASLGPDVLGEKAPANLAAHSKTATVEQRFGELSNKDSKFARKSACATIVDQSFVSGIGSYIKTEALFRARIAPQKKVLTPSEAERLLEAVLYIVRKAYRIAKRAPHEEVTRYVAKNYPFEVYLKKTVEVDGKEYPVEHIECPPKRRTYYVRALQK
jgi:formamidopyrimidine-DNA glycosylase